MTSARAVALRLLLAVETEGAYANLALPQLLRAVRLSQRDRALATELAYGTVRAQGSLDHLLGFALHRPLAALDPDVRAALRLGAYQLWRTRIPRHAAVAETVGLVSPRGRGFANGVLRATAERCRGTDPLELAAIEDPLDRLALAYAHPRWIVEVYLDALGGDLVETEAALASDDARPVVHLAALPGRLTADELVVESGGTRGPSPYAVHLDAGGDPAALRSVRSGAARVQDEGSQFCALALHRAAPPPVEELLADALLSGAPTRQLLVDVTAGPGGKAALLAALGGRRRHVVALELRPHRAALVRSTGVTNVVVADARRPPLTAGCADAVLLDAPCTGLGALRRRPESRWRRHPEDVPGLVALQRELLDAALQLVRPGGVVAYIVCSPHPAEAVVAPRPDAEVLDAPALLGLGADASAPEGGGRRLQLWPHRHGTDAMSATLLRRTA